MQILNYKMLMERTLANLDYVKQRDTNEPNTKGRSRNQKDKAPYAVTQRVNSFLGAFAHVYDQTLKKEHKKKNKDWVFDPSRDIPPNWPVFDSSDEGPGKHTNAPNAGEYCRRVRNALAHGQIKFQAEAKEISHIHLWTRSEQGKGPIDWAGKLTVKQFEKLLREFCNFVDSTFDEKGNPIPSATKQGGKT
jgi:hypothetical protein